MFESAKSRLGQQVGNYRLTGWLGQGGFADVYLGEHIYLKTQCALKVLHLQLSEDTFLNEARTIAGLEHPNIVRVFDYGINNGVPYLVMSYAPNGSLRKRFPKGTRIEQEQVVIIVQQVAAALDYAHQQKLIHRDVKPENILVGQNGQVLLGDFGLVLVAQSASSQAVDSLAGTIPYMAPEQLQGRVRFASDQYALGIVTYEWLCGEHPFSGAFSEIAGQHLLVMPPSLCARVPGLPLEVEQVVFKALAKDPALRYESVVAFANALQDACKQPASIAHTTAQPSRRPGSLWRPALLLVALLVVIAGSLGAWYGLGYLSGRDLKQPTLPVTVQQSPSTAPVGNAPATASAGATAPVGKDTPVSTSGTPAATFTSTPTLTATAVADCIKGSPSTLTFTTPSLAPQVATLTNCGGSTGWSSSVHTNKGGNWLSLSPSSGNIGLNRNETASVTVAALTLPIGTYQGTITFTKGSASWVLKVVYVILA